MKPGKHRLGAAIFGLAVGTVVALWAYRWAADPAPRAERQEEEAAVVAARSLLAETLGFDLPEIVDPLAPNRRVGKAYVYRSGTGWQVSGYYRRGPADLWHPFLIELGPELALVHLKVSDPALSEHDGAPGLEVLP